MKNETFLYLCEIACVAFIVSENVISTLTNTSILFTKVTLGKFTLVPLTFTHYHTISMVSLHFLQIKLQEEKVLCYGQSINPWAYLHNKPKDTEPLAFLNTFDTELMEVLLLFTQDT